MAKRASRRSGAPWWAIAAVVIVAGLLVWWFQARRAEAPALPASMPGARALSEAPNVPPHGDEITGDEKADLERIIRERGVASPGR